MKYNLPKGYLSYSSWSLWKKDKNAFRRKYYEGEKGFETVETLFGKQIAEELEDREKIKDHPILSNIPHYPISEYEIDIVIDEVPIKGFLDLFNDKNFSFSEIKTGHINMLGKDPWDIKKVFKHEQLPFYSLLIETKHGQVEDTTYLHWIGTRFKEYTIPFLQWELTWISRELELTGSIMKFERVITKEERQRIRKEIVEVAQEISEDYTNYLNK